jgi:hypothetical protein
MNVCQIQVNFDSCSAWFLGVARRIILSVIPDR